jgi:hypothetical protein
MVKFSGLLPVLQNLIDNLDLEQDLDDEFGESDPKEREQAMVAYV